VSVNGLLKLLIPKQLPSMDNSLVLCMELTKSRDVSVIDYLKKILLLLWLMHYISKSDLVDDDEPNKKKTTSTSSRKAQIIAEK
jgi:uncharacterized protein YfeS